MLPEMTKVPASVIVKPPVPEPLFARLPRFSAVVVVAVTPVGRPVPWVARLWLPVTVLLLLTMSEPPLLLAKMVLTKLAWAPAAVPMVAVCPSRAEARTPSLPSVYSAPPAAAPL